MRNSQKSAGTVEIEKLSQTENVSSDDRNIGYNVGSYTQRRIAGDFLSGRTRKSSGEPPTENQQTPHLTGS